jgi:hypothetical protein
MKKHRIKIKPTPEIKGLHCAMGGLFLLTTRLLVTNGLDSLALIAAGIFLCIGMARWKKGAGAAAGVVLSLTGIGELIGHTLDGDLLPIVCTVIGLAAALYLAEQIFSVCREMALSSGKTVEILRQRRWWVRIGYTLCAAWSLIDALTGLYPNVGVVMRVAAILVDVFFLSVLFQVQQVVASQQQ